MEILSASLLKAVPDETLLRRGRSSSGSTWTTTMMRELMDWMWHNKIRCRQKGCAASWAERSDLNASHMSHVTLVIYIVSTPRTTPPPQAITRHNPTLRVITRLLQGVECVFYLSTRDPRVVWGKHCSGVENLGPLFLWAKHKIWSVMVHIGETASPGTFCRNLKHLKNFLKHSLGFF